MRPRSFQYASELVELRGPGAIIPRTYPRAEADGISDKYEWFDVTTVTDDHEVRMLYRRDG